MGGEKLLSDSLSLPVLGSPPRGRGKGTVSAADDDWCRITPAWAGKRQADRSSLDIVRDHPRVGGEKFRLLLPVFTGSGSPPRGRGKDLLFNDGQKRIGITPAWAGKSAVRKTTAKLTKDHPRVGGEKIVSRASSTLKSGSPPRGRGKDVICGKKQL